GSGRFSRRVHRRRVHARRRRSRETCDLRRCLLRHGRIQGGRMRAALPRRPGARIAPQDPRGAALAQRRSTACGSCRRRQRRPSRACVEYRPRGAERCWGCWRDPAGSFSGARRAPAAGAAAPRRRLHRRRGDGLQPGNLLQRVDAPDDLSGCRARRPDACSGTGCGHDRWGGRPRACRSGHAPTRASLRRGDPEHSLLGRRRISPGWRRRGQRGARGPRGSTLEGLMLTESSRRSRPGRRAAGVVLPRLVGQDLEVQLAGGETRSYVNLDMAASTPAMEAVADAVIEFLPWYSSVHRGAGFASQVSTRAYEAARSAVATFTGARSTDAVIFVRNTTEAINLLTHCLVLRPGHAVLSTIVEHHANMLPWRRLARVELLDAPESPEQLLADIRRALEDRH